MTDDWGENTNAGPQDPLPHKSDLGGVDDAMAAGTPPAKFEEVGTVVKGTILTAEMAQQRDLGTGKPKFWDDGNPCKQILINLATDERSSDIDDDDGHRRLYVKVPSAMLKAIKGALGKIKLSEAIGGTLAIKYTGNGEATQKGFNKPKLFAAKFVPANGQPHTAPTQTAAPSSTSSLSLVAQAKNAAWELFKTAHPGATKEVLGTEWRALVAKVSGGLAHPDIDGLGWVTVGRAAEGYKGEEEFPPPADSEPIPF